MPEEVKFISKANGMYKRDYTFRMNVMEEIFEIRSCIDRRTDRHVAIAITRASIASRG